MTPADFKPGVYRHYKGPYYLALGLAREDETEELVVVYTRLYARPGVPLSTRRWKVWNEKVVTTASPVPQARFTYVGYETPPNST